MAAVIYQHNFLIG